MGTASGLVQRGVALLAILLGLLVPIVAGVLTPAHAVSDQSEGGNPRVECGELLYLDKFDWNDNGSGSFDVGETSGDLDDTDDGYEYTSTTGVRITYTTDAEGEVFDVSWWSTTTPVDLVWEKAGHTDAPSNSGPYDEATAGTESVTGNAYSHLTWCYDEDEPEEPTVEVSGECDEAYVTITNPLEGEVDVEVDILINDVFVETITASKTYTLQPGETLTATDGGSTTHGTFTWQDCTEPTVSLTGECEFATVVITNPAQFQFQVEVFINGDSQGFITETTDYVLAEGDVLTTDATGDESVAWQDCSEPEPAVWTATPQCVDGTSQVVVTVVDPDATGGEVSILIDGVVVDTTATGGTWTGEAGQLLQVVVQPLVFAALELEDELQILDVEPQVVAEATFEDCFVPPPPPPPPPPPVPTTAAFTVSTACVDNSPTVAYVVDVTEGDDPVGTITLVVADADGVVLIEETLTGDAADTLLLPGRDGDAVQVSWDFDDSVEDLTLADDCAEVLGVVEEPDPAPLPEVKVKGEVVAAEELPAAGLGRPDLLILGGGLLALGCTLLLLERRQVRVRV